MTREILFRGKRVDNGEWETGSLVVIRGGCSDEQVFIADKMTGYHTPVIPSSIGQYTGLDDKNGKKIFEGDVLELANGRTGCVKWIGNAFVFEHTDKKLGNSYGYRYDTATIISNIHLTNDKGDRS